MTVRVFGIVPVFFPLFQLSPASDGWFEQIVPHRRDAVAEFLVIAQFIRRLDGVGEQVVDDFLVVSDTFFGSVPALLGRPAVRRDECAVRASYQVVFPEMADLLENRIRGFAQEFLIAAKGVMLSQVLGIPGASRRIPLPVGNAAGVVHGLDGPAAHIAVVMPGVQSADFANAIHVVNE